MVHFSVLVLSAVVSAVSAFPAEHELLARKNSPPVCDEIFPRPAKTVCQQRGTLMKPAVFKTFDYNDYGGSVSKCFDLCGRYSECLAVSYHSGLDSDNGRCTLYSKTTKQMKFKQDTDADETFYNRSCLSCVTAKNCVPTLQNGNFETGAVSPWSVGGDDDNTGVIVSPGAAGTSNAVSIVIQPASGGFARLGQLVQGFALCQGKDYTFKFSYKATGFGSTPMIFLQDDYQNGGSTILEVDNVTTEYQTASVTINTDDYRGSANFLIFNEDEDRTITVFFDQISVKKA